MKNQIVIMISMLTLFSCSSYKKLPTVETLDIKKYEGRWYEIARLPTRFEKGLECVTATYSIKENGKIKVVNRGQKEKNNKVKESTGTAWVPDANYPGRLKVRFFWPFAGKYWVIELDDDYRYALVGTPSRKYLWILSKDKKLEQEVYNQLVEIAIEQEFPVNDLLKVNQDCD